MPQLVFVVVCRRGSTWQEGIPLEGQREWDAHARFMDELTKEGFVVLGGPLETRSEALLIVRARSESEIEQRLAADSWYKLDLLRPAWMAPWVVRLGSLP